MFKISEFARLSGTTAIQLRHYDEIGLFRPVWVDPNSGYRFYTPAQLAELHRIIALRDVGLPLREITSLVASGADLREALSLQRRRLVGQREQLDRRLASLDIRVEMADEPGFPDVVVRRLPAELVASTRVHVGPEESLELCSWPSRCLPATQGSVRPAHQALCSMTTGPAGSETLRCTSL